jgi:hypothetical protein
VTEASRTVHTVGEYARVVEPVNIWEYERLAAAKLDPGAYAYFAGGANDELVVSSPRLL